MPDTVSAERTADVADPSATHDAADRSAFVTGPHYEGKLDMDLREADVERESWQLEGGEI